jgi:hypothetical protein
MLDGIVTAVEDFQNVFGLISSDLHKRWIIRGHIAHKRAPAPAMTRSMRGKHVVLREQHFQAQDLTHALLETASVKDPNGPRVGMGYRKLVLFFMPLQPPNLVKAKSERYT